MNDISIDFPPIDCPALDYDVLVVLQEVMEEDYPVLIETFLADSAQRIGGLHEAAAAGDANQICQAAHSFKGSCSNLGALRLSQLCRELEDRARRGVVLNAMALVGRIEQEFNTVLPLYNAERLRFA